MNAVETEEGMLAALTAGVGSNCRCLTLFTAGHPLDPQEEEPEGLTYAVRLDNTRQAPSGKIRQERSVWLQAVILRIGRFQPSCARRRRRRSSTEFGCGVICRPGCLPHSAVGSFSIVLALVCGVDPWSV